MKKPLLSLFFTVAGLTLMAQTPRLSLVEEFTGETCPPCAAYNPGFNALLSLPANTAIVVPLKWQVPIPSAPTATWSLFQTNSGDITWRASTYGYGINSAPSVRIDGQMPTVFGAAGENITQQNSTVFQTAQSYTSAFSITLNRAWDPTFSTITVTVNINATANFTANGALKFRLVMTEEHIEFPTQPGTNGEKVFEDVAIKTFPSTSGTNMVGTWTSGQSQTIVLTCALPSYVRDKGEIGFVGFIQDDGNRKVAQAVRSKKIPFANDAKAISATVPNYFNCGNSGSADLVVKNNGDNAITAFTVTPMINANAGTAVTWNGNLAVGASTTINIASITSTVGGGQNCDLNISAVSGTDNNLTNNTAKANFYLAGNYSGQPVAEGFVSTAFPPAGFGVVNANGGSSWRRTNVVGGFGLTFNSAAYDFFTNSAIGDADDLLLPPLNLAGAQTPSLTFDVAYTQYQNQTGPSNDRLEVSVSDDCGLSWTTLYNKSGAALSTAPMVNGQTAWTPGPSHWRKETVLIQGFNFPTLLVKFTAVSSFGDNLYLDNINLKQNDPVGISEVKNNYVNIDLYPNPTKGETNLRIITVEPSKATVSVVNVIGQVVYTSAVELDGGENTIQINAADFAAGVYNVVVNSKNGKVVKKLTVN